MSATLVALAFASARDGTGAEPGDRGLRPLAAFLSVEPAEIRAAAIFEEAAKVLVHPRCANCHAGKDQPTQGERMAPHLPRVTGGRDGLGVGLECRSCHRDGNVAASGVPGAPHWRLAPPGAGLAGRSPAALCAQLKDPAQTGGMALEALVRHLAFDPLVLWAWEPGAKRRPAPGRHADFVALVAAWADAGAPCPAG